MSFLSAWSRGIRGKLFFMVALPVCLLGGIGFLSLNGIKSLRADLNLIARERLKINDATGELRADGNAIGRLIWRSAVMKNNPAERKKGLEQVEARIRVFQETLESYGKLPLVDKGRALFNSIEGNWKGMQHPLRKAIELLGKNTAEGDAEAYEVLLSGFTSNLTPMLSTLQEADQLSNSVNEKIANASEERSDRVNFLVLIASAIGALVLCGVGFFTASRLAQILTKITEKIGDASMQVGSASQQLSSASQQLSSGATEGAASLEETVSSIEELSSMVKINADHATEASMLSQTSTTSANEGQAEIQKLIEAMSDISKSSRKIAEIINVIDDIAFQTNLLALNAAVEAARAGEQGKGFAVVAEAVRSLAQRSAAAAKDISGMIRESVTKTENGAIIADQSGAVLRNIVGSVKKVSDLNGEIATASRQQSEGLGQISQAMNQLDTVTQGNAASAEEAAASAEEMSAQAMLLQQMVSELSQVVQGTAKKAAPAANRAPLKAAAAPAAPAAKPAPRSATQAEAVIPFGSSEPSVGATGTEGF